MADRLNYRRTAGVEVKRGRPSLGRKPKKEVLQRLYVEEEKSIRDTAKVLECTKDMVYRALHKYKIERRAHIREPKLSQYDPGFLRKLVSDKGYRKAAVELEIDKSTLWRYFRRLKQVK